MIWVVLFLLFTSLFIYGFKNGINEHIIGISILSIWIIIILITLVPVFQIKTKPSYEKTKIVNVKQIISINFGSNIHGQFTLGSGIIKEVDYFYYIVKDGNYYRKEKVMTSQTFIEESDQIRPNITTFERQKYWNWLKWVWGFDSTENQTYYVITIPKGSIIEYYNIN